MVAAISICNMYVILFEDVAHLFKQEVMYVRVWQGMQGNVSPGWQLVA